jgi:hypothetical protein
MPGAGWGPSVALPLPLTAQISEVAGSSLKKIPVISQSKSESKLPLMPVMAVDSRSSSLQHEQDDLQRRIVANLA